MNRIVNPLIPLDSEDSEVPTLGDVNDFLDLTKEPNERGTKLFHKDWNAKNYDGSSTGGKHPVLGPIYRDSQYKTRVLAVIFDTDEYDAELKNM